METRDKTVIPFLGSQPLESILGAKCPTKEDVFRHFYFLRYEKNLSVAEAKKKAVLAAKVFWVEAGIATKKDVCAVRDLDKLFNEYKVH